MSDPTIWLHLPFLGSLPPAPLQLPRRLVPTWPPPILPNSTNCPSPLHSGPEGIAILDVFFFFFFPALVRYKSHGGSLFTNLYPTLCNPMDYSLPGSSVHGTLQARILEWVAITGEDPFPGDLPDPGIKPASLQANSLPTEPPGSSVMDIFPILKSFLVGTPKFYSLSKFQLCHTVLSASPHHTLRSSDLIPLTADSLNPFTHLSLFPPAPPSSPDNHHSTHWF